MKNRQLGNKLEAYLNYHYSSETAITYMRLIDKFTLKNSNYLKLELTEIEDYIISIKSNGGSVAYRITNLAAIKSFYRFLLDSDLINHHPCARFFISENTQSGKDFDSFLEMEEMELLFELREERYKNLRTRNRVLIGLLIYQGLTSRELVNLKLKHIDLNTGMITIQAGVKTKKRALKLRANQMLDMIKYINEDRLKLSGWQSDKLILSMRGTGMTVDGLCSFFDSMQCAFYKKLTPKNIRASVISNWINERKMSIENVQLKAGHRYPSSTEKYIKNDTDLQRQTLNNLHNLVFG